MSALDAFECPYCGDGFHSRKSWGGHKGNCPENPDRRDYP